jgi:hypothetical protein
MVTFKTFTETPQFKQGMAVEAFLDDYFRAKGWTIKRVTPHEERVLCLGDRVYSRGDGTTLHIEYKSGIQTGKTGNIFLETISVDTTGKAGWVYTCRADYLFYACVLNGVILVFVPSRLRAKMPELKQQFREVATGKGQNVGYNTHGLIVPLAYAEKYLAAKVIEL